LLAGEDAAFAVVAAVLAADVDCSGNEEDELLRFPAIHGKAFDALLINNLDDGCVVGGDLVDASLHCYLLVDAADGECDGLRGGLADRENDAVLDVGAEAGEVDGEGVGADGQAGEGVFTGGGGLGGLLVTGAFLLDEDGGSGDGSSALILYETAEAGRGELR